MQGERRRQGLRGEQGKELVLERCGPSRSKHPTERGKKKGKLEKSQLTIGAKKKLQRNIVHEKVEPPSIRSLFGCRRQKKGEGAAWIGTMT